MDRSEQLHQIVRDWAVRNLVNSEGTQTIQIEPIDIMILNDGKLIAEYSHRIVVKIGAYDENDQRVKGSLLAFLESLAAELRNQGKAVMTFEPSLAVWDQDKKSFKGTLPVRM